MPNFTKRGSWDIERVAELPPTLGLCCDDTRFELAKQKNYEPTAHPAFLSMTTSILREFVL
jgi:hypothetical protein